MEHGAFMTLLEQKFDDALMQAVREGEALT